MNDPFPKTVGLYFRCGAELIYEGEITEDQRSDITRRIEAEGFVEPDGRKVTNSKAVELTEIDQEKYAPFTQTEKRPALPLPQIRVFDSGIALSRHLGYNHNAVGQALTAARRKGDRKPICTLRGVSFRFVEDAPD